MDDSILDGQVRLPTRESLREVISPSTGEKFFLPKRWNDQVHKLLLNVLRHPSLQCKNTASTYGHQILRFDTFADQECGTSLDAPPEGILKAYLAYLKRCRVHVIQRRKKFYVSVDPCDPMSPKPATVLLTHEALKTFYRIAKSNGDYNHDGDLFRHFDVSALRKTRGLTEFDILSQASQKRRRNYNPGSYFLFVDKKWIVRGLVGEGVFSDLVRKAFERHGAKKRDCAILELMLMGGPRLSETAGATLEGWSVLDKNRRPFQQRIRLKNKGDGELPVKEVEMAASTAALMRQYFMEERPIYDPLASDYRIWAVNNNVKPSDYFSPETYLRFISSYSEVRQSSNESGGTNRTPIFLTCTGKPYSADAFRQVAWRPALAGAECPIDARPHQMRHWFVTTSIIGITIICKNDQIKIANARKQLGQYMHWKWPEDTLKIYDQSLQGIFGENLATVMAQHAEEYLRMHDGKVKEMVHEVNFRSTEMDARSKEDAILFDQIRRITGIK